MRLNADTVEFERFLAVASVYWSNNIRTPPSGDEPGCILVEILHQDLRVALRNLTVANALRRIFPARLIVYTGTDQDWSKALWTRFDTSLVRQLAAAYQATDVIDVHEAVTARIAAAEGDGEVPELAVGNRILPVDTGRPGIAPEDLESIVNATACRLLQVPRLAEEHRDCETYHRVRARTTAFSAVYDSLFTAFSPDALVTSHVDYNHWGLAVESARRFNTPVVHVQTTGTLKAYTLFPEQAAGAPTFRAALTNQIGEFFEKRLWPQRTRIRRSAEMVSWRAKGNLGRPSWWRGGATASLDFRTDTERAQIRRHAVHRFEFDPDKPTVTVFNHSVSDALGTNVEFFADLADWFERTAEHAREHTEVNWLFLDHPSQKLYDVTGFFDGVAKQHADMPHMAFAPSAEVGKNILWSLTDLAVTVRGSISNELPAYGIQAIQAGWSEWSSCGVSRVATGIEDYWSLLDTSLAELRAGVPMVSAEQRERARLWHWFYRSAADVCTPLVPHWEAGHSELLLRQLRISMQHVESDGDPAFTATRRMWLRREPFLTRFDLAGPAQALSDEMWGE
ncbi:MAG: hypothetical protein WCA46_03560 [Actinocatenispora sp.]